MEGRILVVDDEPAVAFLMRQIFRKELRDDRLRLDFAKDGAEALDLLSREDIDVVLSDINMPGMDGLTLLTEVREKHPLVKVIIISAYFDPDNIRKANDRGAYEFINKPVKIQEMKESVTKALIQVRTRKHSAND